jgi:hypothetical protein
LIAWIALAPVGRANRCRRGSHRPFNGEIEGVVVENLQLFCALAIVRALKKMQ